MLSWSHSSEDRLRPSPVGTAFIPHCCGVSWERPLRARVIIYPHPRRTKFRGSNQQGPVSTGSSQLYTPRRCCYVGHQNSSVSEVTCFPEFGNSRESHSSKSSEVLPFALDRDDHQLFWKEKTSGVDRTFQRYQSSPAWKFGNSIDFHSVLEGNISRMEQSGRRICSSRAIAPSTAWKGYYKQRG